MNKSQIKEARQKLNREIEKAFDNSEVKEEIYEAIRNEKKNCTMLNEYRMNPTKLYSALYDLEAPQVHTISSQLKKANKVYQLGMDELANKFIDFVNSYADQAEYIKSLVPEAKAPKKETPIEELMKRQAKKDDFVKFASFNSSIGNAHILEDNSLYINGDVFKFEERAEVGIKLGEGDRVHYAEAFTAKDKYGETHIYVSRKDKFWRSYEASVIDLWNRIPDNLKSEV